jgi:predicted alpha/beta superfamily hydrolase
MTEFVVRPPAGHPHWEPLFLAGDGDALGQWEAAGVRLDPWEDGTFRKRVEVRGKKPVRFLVTRGHWRRAETDGQGNLFPPREFSPKAGATVEAEVAGFGRDSVKYHPDFPSTQLVHPRPVTVWLPPGYESEPDRRYPVLYLHDGQNLFDPETAFGGTPWGADDTAERLIRRGSVEPLLIVGIGNTPDRLKEYGPLDLRPGPWDLARAYGRFVTGELKPFVDRTYRTMPGPDHTGVGGSSMGGLISLALGRWYPEVFGRVMAMSPSLWYDQESTLRGAAGNTGWLAGVRLWLDVGGKEGASGASQQANVRRVRRLAKLLKDHGLAAGRLKVTVDAAAGHDERAWAYRLGHALPWLFPAG